MTEEKPEPDHIMQFFAYEHLQNERLRNISRLFADLANVLTAKDSLFFLPRNAERTVALRKLLEAKDAAVRAALAR